MGQTLCRICRAERAALDYLHFIQSGEMSLHARKMYFTGIVQPLIDYMGVLCGEIADAICR